MCANLEDLRGNGVRHFGPRDEKSAIAGAGLTPKLASVALM